MARQNLILGLQAVSAIGILVLGLLTYFGQSGRDLRLEMRQGFESIRVEFRGEIAALRKEIADVRKEMRQGFESIRVEFNEEMTAFKTEMRDEFTTFKTEMKEEHADIRKEMREEHADTRKELRHINTRLGRVEGHLGIPTPQKPVP